MCAQMDEHLENIDCGEQQLCQQCGLCCNGTLFGFVRLSDEDVMHIETHISDIVIQDRNRSFKQPCRYYQEKSCAVYSSWRPSACSTFECNLLIRYRQKKISFAEAANAIEEAVGRVEHLRNVLSTASGDNQIALSKLFDEYVALYSSPDQSLILEYGVLQFRLKRDFRKYDDTRNVEDAENAEEG